MNCLNAWSVVGHVGCVILCHLWAARADNVRHKSRWLALAALIVLAWQAWPTYDHDAVHQARSDMTPVEAGILQLISESVSDGKKETQNRLAIGG